MSTEINIPSKSVFVSDSKVGNEVPNSPLTRVFDITLIALAFPYILLFFLLISLAIVLDSKGGVFYKQTRIGKGGRRFKALKFRTMIQNADQILQQFLDESPELKAEWLATHKLKRDPRVTRVGTILRKLSLDELPQFWNIIIGDMSLIGPRPIVDAEIEKYGKCFELYIQARPGLTGLWQVSGRSDTSYQRRVELDEYYLLNRNIKLDIQILLRTVYVVLGRKGAY
jgi:lipopolysaccharide/colanic/teichoic acid biosynthesis glycosyltransferase